MYLFRSLDASVLRHQRKNQLDNAIVDFTKVIILKPENPRAYFYQERAYFEKEKFLKQFLIFQTLLS